MKVDGNILLDENGCYQDLHSHNAIFAFDDFTEMVKEADRSKDTLFYVGENWENFYANCFNPDDDFWKEVGDIAHELLFIGSNPIFIPMKIGSKEFEQKPQPKTNGGFAYKGHPDSYVYDKSSIDKWHSDWIKQNPHLINWKDTNGIMPRRDRAIEILRKELAKQQKTLKEAPDSLSGLSHSEKQYLLSVDLEELHEDEVVVKFYSLVMEHKSGNVQAFALKLAEEICKANFYNEERDLVQMENDFRNNRDNRGKIQKIIKDRQKKIAEKKKEYKINFDISAIYSIVKDGNFQFLSVDTQHGMFELCDGNGNHLGEYRFDGSPNGYGTSEADHGLYCVGNWMKKNNK